METRLDADWRRRLHSVPPALRRHAAAPTAKAASCSGIRCVARCQLHGLCRAGLFVARHPRSHANPPGNLRPAAASPAAVRAANAASAASAASAANAANAASAPPLPGARLRRGLIDRCKSRLGHPSRQRACSYGFPQLCRGFAHGPDDVILGLARSLGLGNRPRPRRHGLSPRVGSANGSANLCIVVARTVGAIDPASCTAGTSASTRARTRTRTRTSASASARCPQPLRVSPAGRLR